ncbi:hypothetical protein E4T43_01939 [Aureobasidium subglaciale]|nr:hypothetical protein E4T43_01939 [Aureobasidium subglaciale]
MNGENKLWKDTVIFESTELPVTETKSMSENTFKRLLFNNKPPSMWRKIAEEPAWRRVARTAFLVNRAYYYNLVAYEPSTTRANRSWRRETTHRSMSMSLLGLALHQDATELRSSCRKARSISRLEQSLERVNKPTSLRRCSFLKNVVLQHRQAPLTYSST